MQHTFLDTAYPNPAPLELAFVSYLQQLEGNIHQAESFIPHDSLPFAHAINRLLDLRFVNFQFEGDDKGWFISEKGSAFLKEWTAFVLGHYPSFTLSSPLLKFFDAINPSRVLQWAHNLFLTGVASEERGELETMLFEYQETSPDFLALWQNRDLIPVNSNHQVKVRVAHCKSEQGAGRISVRLNGADKDVLDDLFLALSKIYPDLTLTDAISYALRVAHIQIGSPKA